MRTVPYFWRGILAVAMFAAVLLALLRDRTPRLPANRDHAVDQPETRCMSCHGHTARRPRPATHPPRDDCFSCHRDGNGERHPRPGAPQSVPGGWRDDPRLAGTRAEGGRDV